MIPYEPRPNPANVNVGESRPLKDFLVLSAGLAACVVLIYWLLGLAVEVGVPYISPQLEVRLGRAFNAAYLAQEDHAASRRLKPVLDELIKGLPASARRLDYRLVVSNESTVNAVALPGGTILVYRGLLDKLNSEAELSFVLAHELGHFYHRDHLKGLGRSLLVNILIIGMLSWLLLKLPTPSFGTVFIGTLGTGLIIFLHAPYTMHIWYGSFDLMAHFADAIVSWGVTGLWLGWWLRRA